VHELVNTPVWDVAVATGDQITQTDVRATIFSNEKEKSLNRI